MDKLILTTPGELDLLISKSIRKELDARNSKETSVSEIFTLSEASEYLDLAKQTIYGFTSKRQIPFLKKGKKLYFKKSDLEAWLLEGKRPTIKEIESKGGLLS